jgi:serine phosphatase RsbU (regulator of sigma subunit)/ligand-binding sensor domain-containing protein
MKYLPGIILISVILGQTVLAQEVIYPVTNYTTKDYGREFNPTNWSVTQDKSGIIYAANGFKLLEFDGRTWSSCPINKEAWILSLASDSSGIIYAGSQNEFGYFAPDRVKGLKYFSLSDSLKGDDQYFTNVWKVDICSLGVIFQAEEKLFIYRNGRVRTVNPTTSFHTSFVVRNILYTRQRDVGLTEWKNDKFVLTSGGEMFKSAGIFFMVPFGTDGREILVGTRELGFLIYNTAADIKFRPFHLKDKSLIDQSLISGGIRLQNGNIGLSTSSGGVIVVDHEGNTSAVIDKAAGIADNEVKQIITDRDQNLWLALNNGISNVEYSSPLSFYSEKSGIEGSVNSIIRYNGLLYAGTTAGLFIQTKSGLSDKGFSTVTEIKSPVRCLVISEEALIAGTDAGIYKIKNNSIEKIGNENTFGIHYSSGLKLLFSGGSKGLSVYKADGSFRKIKLSEEVVSDIISITGKDSDSSDSCVVWIGTRNDGAIRISVNKNYRSIIDRYNTAEGLASGAVFPFYREGEILFGSSEGLYSFIDEQTVMKSLPDSLKNSPGLSKGYFTSFSFATDSIGKSVSSFLDTPSKTWVCAGNKLAYVDKNNQNLLVNQPFMAVDAGKVNTIYQDAEGICWFGTSEGLIRYEISNSRDYSARFPVLLRRVIVTSSDSVLCSGRYYISDTTGFRIVSEQPLSFKPQLRFADNSLRFDFSASFFEHVDKMMFSCRLEGFDPGWKSWEHKYYQEYTNLHEGSYVFHVRARNVYGQISDEAQYAFTILPPWYRSVTAYFLYIVVSLLLVWLIVKIYSARLKRENLILEGIVKERTAEVVRQRDVLEYQKNEIEDSIRYAGRIQNAVLPASQDFTDLVPESFVFFRPRDIVSGDFYWVSKVENKLIISAADCTGHGVPGAFMSMLGVAFLNEIVNKDHIVKPDIILGKLREKVIEALQQQGISGEAKDGMDIVVISVDYTEMQLNYAGAYNPLLMVRNKQLSEISADKMPIAIYERMKEFTNHEIKIEKGDIFYFFSDGYEDQFGGPEGKKFKGKKFRELLVEISSNPMKEQKEIIENTFIKWKGDQDQVDDIVVLGVRI